MSYKTILVDAAPSQRTEAIATCAGRIALDQQAHLVGLASTGIKPPRAGGPAHGPVRPGRRAAVARLE